MSNDRNQATNHTGKIIIKEVCAIDGSSGKKRISPLGQVTGLDGRSFAIKANVVLAELEDNGLSLPLNVDHGYSSKHGSEAAGWFTEFEAREDGLYATLELNELGNELIDAKKYKYLSPEFLTDDRRNVVAVVGVALVNQPNLLNESLNNIQLQPTDQEHIMTEQEINALKASNQQLKNDNQALTEKIKTIELNSLAQKVDSAIEKGELTPAKKEFALTLEANALDTYLTIEKGQTKKTENNGMQQQSGESDHSNCAIAQQFNG